VEKETRAEPVPKDAEMGTGDTPVHDVGRVILTLRITLETPLRRWGGTHLKKPHNHPLPLLLKNLLKKPLPVLNPRRRGSRLWLGVRIYHGFGSSLP